jgi:GT2 family glycosyltransferase
VLPARAVVVWQGDDVATRDAAMALQEQCPFQLNVVHLSRPGIVPAENLGVRVVDAARQAHPHRDIILLIDDDATAPPDWVERHLSHYKDPFIGAVGGSANNFHPDETAFPKRTPSSLGRVTWFGHAIGNMYDLPDAWRDRPPIEVDHLVGYNMSLRRSAFDRFEERLRPYWQLFEMDACLQVRQRGYRVLFDFATIVRHYPTNTAYTGGRDGDLAIKIYNSAYNQAFVFAKHSRPSLLPWRLGFLMAVGSVGSPGFLGSLVAARRYGDPWHELSVLLKTWQHRLLGWSDGVRAATNAKLPMSADVRLRVNTGCPRVTSSAAQSYGGTGVHGHDDEAVAQRYRPLPSPEASRRNCSNEVVATTRT